jgi:hypothetical protein
MLTASVRWRDLPTNKTAVEGKRIHEKRENSFTCFRWFLERA